MGPTSSQHITENQTILTTVTQVAQQSCKIGCAQNQTNVTVISKNQKGDINIDETCQLSGIECIMSSTIDAQIDNILSAINDQSITQSSGLIPNFSAAKSSLDVTQLINNQITQLQYSACEIAANTNQDNIYIF